MTTRKFISIFLAVVLPFLFASCITYALFSLAWNRAEKGRDMSSEEIAKIEPLLDEFLAFREVGDFENIAEKSVCKDKFSCTLRDGAGKNIDSATTIEQYEKLYCDLQKSAGNLIDKKTTGWNYCSPYNSPCGDVFIAYLESEYKNMNVSESLWFSADDLKLYVIYASVKTLKKENIAGIDEVVK